MAPTAGAGAQSWLVYWTVTETTHNSKVQAGENAGEFLTHEFVVNQNNPADNYTTTNDLP